MRQNNRNAFHKLLAATALLLSLFAFAGFAKESSSIHRPLHSENLISHRTEKKTVQYFDLKNSYGSLILFYQYYAITKIADFSRQVCLTEIACARTLLQFNDLPSLISFIKLPSSEEAHSSFS